MGFLGFGRKKEDPLIKDIENLDTFLQEVEHWFFQLRRLREKLNELQSYSKNISNKGKLANQLRLAIAQIEGEIAEETARQQKQEEKIIRNEAVRQRALEAEKQWIGQKLREVLSDVHETQVLCRREIFDSSERRIPIVFLGIAEELLKNANTIHQIAVAHDAADGILTIVYRFYFPRRYNKLKFEEIDAKLEAEAPRNTDDQEGMRIKANTLKLLNEANEAKNLCLKEIMDAATRRIPILLIEVAEILLKNARTNEGHLAAQYAANQIFDAIYKIYFPRLRKQK